MIKFFKNCGKRKLISAASVLIALIIESMPLSAVLERSVSDAAGNGYILRELYSFFSTMPTSCGNVGPIISAAFTVVLAAMMIISLAFDKQNPGVMFAFSVAAAIASLFPLVVFGYRGYCIAGGIVSALLIAASVVLYLWRRQVHLDSLVI